MSAVALKHTDKLNEKVMLKVKRNARSKVASIWINTLTPNFEYTNAENRIVKPNTLLKI